MPTQQPPIYSVGYGQLEPAQLKALARLLDAVVVDVRANPGDRGRCRKGFRRHDLETLLGAHRYLWKGDILPGFGQDTQSGREWLATFNQAALLLCAEHAPGDCHRHHTIAVPLYDDPIKPEGPRIVLHVFEGTLIRADDLEDAINREVEGDEPPAVDLRTYLAWPAAKRAELSTPRPRKRAK